MFFIVAISVIDHSFITEPSLKLDKEMFRGQLTLIDEFTDYGSVINHSIKSEYDYCYSKRQYLEINDYDSLNIVNEYQEEKFANQFINGHFDGFIEELIQITQISANNFIVLTNSGKLIQINDFNISSIHTIAQLQTEQPLHLTVIDEQFVLVIMDGFNGKILLSDENRELKKIEFAFITNLITRVIVLNNKLYLAVKNDGLYIFNIFQSDIFMLKRVQQIFISDIIIVQDNQPNIIKIYILDYVEGISIFIYNELTNEIQLNKEIEIIDIAGHIMKLLNYSLFIVEQINKDLFYLHDIQLTNNTYYLINRYLLKGWAKDIIVNEQYILLLCDNGHYVIFHSISEQFYNTTNHQSIQIPGLKQLVKISQNEYYGITRHKLIKFSLIQKPASLWCFTNDTGITQFQLEYNLQSTQCPHKINKTDDLAMCESQFHYNILIRYPYSSQTYYIILFFVIILLISALGFAAFNLYRFLNIKNTKEYLNNLDDKSTTKISSSSDNKSSKDLTPQYFSNSLTPNQID